MNKNTPIARLFRALFGIATTEDVTAGIKKSIESLLSGFRKMATTLKSAAEQLDDVKDEVQNEINSMNDIILLRREQMKDLDKEVVKFAKIASNIEKMFELFEEEEDSSK